MDDNSTRPLNDDEQKELQRLLVDDCGLKEAAEMAAEASKKVAAALEAYDERFEKIDRLMRIVLRED